MTTQSESEASAFVVVQQKIGFKGSEWAGLLQSSAHRANVIAAFHHDTATALSISPSDVFDLSMQANLLLLRFRVRCRPAVAAAMKELLFHGTFAQMWEYYNKWKAAGGGGGGFDALARRRSSVALGAHVVYFFGADWAGLLRAHGPLLLAAAKEAVYNMTYDLGLYTSPADVAARLEPSKEGATLACALPEQIDAHSPPPAPSAAQSGVADPLLLPSLWEARLSRCHFDELWRLYARRRSRRRCSFAPRDEAGERGGEQSDEVSLMQTHHVVTFHGSRWADITADTAHELPLQRAFASDVLRIVGLPVLDPHVAIDPNRTTLRVSFDLAHPAKPSATELNVKLRDHVFRATEQFYTTHAGRRGSRQTDEAAAKEEHGRWASGESATTLGSRLPSLTSTYQTIDLAGLRGGAVVTTHHELHLVDEDGEAAAAEGEAGCPAFKAHVMQEMDATLRRCITDDLAVTLQLPVNTFVKVEDCTPLSANSWRVQLSIQHSSMLRAENIDDAIAHGAFYATRQCLLACRARSAGGDEGAWDGPRASLIAAATASDETVTGGSNTSADPTHRASLRPRHTRRLLTQHRIRINGPSWDVVLRYAEAELRTAFQADLHGSLAIAQGVLTSVRFSLGSLVADFRVEHCDRYSRKTIDALLRQCTYAYTWAVYMRYVPSAATAGDAAAGAKPVVEHDSGQRTSSVAAADSKHDDDDDDVVHNRPSTTPPPIDKASSAAAETSGGGGDELPRLGATAATATAPMHEQQEQQQQQPSFLREVAKDDAPPLSYPASSHSRHGGRDAPQARIEGSAGTQVYNSSTRVAGSTSASESKTANSSGSMTRPHALPDAREMLPVADTLTAPWRQGLPNDDERDEELMHVPGSGQVRPSTVDTNKTDTGGERTEVAAEEEEGAALSSATQHGVVKAEDDKEDSNDAQAVNEPDTDASNVVDERGDRSGNALYVTEDDTPQTCHDVDLAALPAPGDALAADETPLPLAAVQKQPCGVGESDVMPTGTVADRSEVARAAGGLATTALKPIGFEGARWQRMTPSQVIAAQQTFLLEAAHALEVDPAQLALSDYAFHEGLIFRFAIVHAPGMSEQAVRQMNAKLGTCRYERMWDLYRDIDSPSRRPSRETHKRASAQADKGDADDARHLHAYADNTSWHTDRHDQDSVEAAAARPEAHADMNTNTARLSETHVVAAATQPLRRQHDITPTRPAAKEGGLAAVRLPPMKHTQSQTVNATTATQSTRTPLPPERHRVGEGTTTTLTTARSPGLSPPVTPTPSLSPSLTRLGSANTTSRRQAQQRRRSRTPQGRRQRGEVRVERLEAVLPQYTMRNARYPNSTAITNTSSYNSRNTLQDPAPAQERSTRVLLPPLQQSQQHMAMLRALLPSTRRVTPTRFDQYYKRFWPYLVPPDVMRMELEEEEEEEEDE